MIRALPVLIALAVATPATGDDWPPGRLLAALSGDWNGDGATDLAVLVAGEDFAADLLIYFGGYDGLNVFQRVPRAAFMGPMGGQMPGLEARTPTSFMLTSEQIGIGRSPWSQQVTIAWRDGGFVVAGFTHGFYDRLDPERQGRCDVNLLTGGWEGHLSPGTDLARRGGLGQDGPRALALVGLTEDFFPAVCLELFAE